MNNDVIEIDGSFGEGGGQILRTALSLSAITKRPFEIFNIRANRKIPGLSYQHLQAVNATSQICNAKVVGNLLRSTDLKFYPGEVKAGAYRLDIGTAGSVSLVLQTIFYPLSLANKPSSITIIGGTHVSHSPCIDYLMQQWLYFLKKIGFDAEIETLRAGYYPRGGGEVFININPARPQHPIRIEDRGRLIQVMGISAVSNLDINIAFRQQTQAKKKLLEQNIPHEISMRETPALGRGTMLLLVGKFEHSQCCYFSLGAIGKRAETVADEACNEFFSFLETKGVIDEHLADQLIIPLALTKGTSQFTTPRVTQHLLTNIEIVKLFLPVTVDILGNLNEEGSVKIH
ncbi:MAG: RNA 3'-phosphate cyclase [Candidatus Brocadia sp. AMX2]|uniref:RNA 3'-terminal phosphate cyclase n=1 Tax=Candidatus Brocadia sinica JPN1 TaxID=1197129 RepID=A0ABQ0JSF0_9BACT|nr:MULTISPECIES: RNA 3'-terminal phosphate cyclase [Brocadia]KXK28188.1 MAG: RNA-3'-phosphate cyclase [Candidatus Brocadia sinica]MBC6931303.1 RNA 3'-phosphate cyclase [Candidatus Brocadia sp.]MBL1168650.1 RNA 3'-phosphate cyclase [Candidatus Brocadia sp. AMX1]NOG43249.1 RNA 3'-phosphate cyclase [Planctomycetota bacterium]KAA0245957.1 MAG: RNA 3'-phosphate cyclase [Candidatus Brocadia sp. AMX2]